MQPSNSDVLSKKQAKTKSTSIEGKGKKLPIKKPSKPDGVSNKLPKTKPPSTIEVLTRKNVKVAPSNHTDLKISMRTLLSKEIQKPTELMANMPTVDSSQMIQIIQVYNSLPYFCLVHFIPPPDIDWVYYAALDSKGEKIFYRAEYPVSPLPSLSWGDFKNSKEKEFTLVMWPVKNDVIGSPSYFGPVSIHEPFYLGVYDLEVAFEKESDIAIFNQIKPLLEKHYGKAALPATVRVQENNYDVYLPSTNTIHLSANRNNLVHELVHACRKQAIFCNKEFKFDEETELIEEFFAEGVSNMIKDELNLSSNNYLIPNAVYGSTLGYNYDFRIVEPSLITQNLQSSWGGILNLENARYYLASEAYHKVAIEYYIKTKKYFGREFNRLYYDEVQRSLANPSKEMFFSICEQLLPTVEGKPIRTWLTDQKLFETKIVAGEKIFMDIEDYYYHNEWIGTTNINLFTTFGNGSDWVDDKNQYNQNGETVKLELKNLATGKVEHTETYTIPEYANGFGTIRLYFHHVEKSSGLEYFIAQDKNYGIDPKVIKVNSALYSIRLTSKNATRTYYRILGEAMFNHKDKIIVANPYQCCAEKATIQLIHYNREGKKTVIPPQAFNNQFAAIACPFIKDGNCEPGILQILVSSNGLRENFQRNIGYGGFYGGQQLMIGAEQNTFLPEEQIVFA
jgi:hypothetical protein